MRKEKEDQKMKPKTSAEEMKRGKKMIWELNKRKQMTGKVKAKKEGNKSFG